MLFGTSAMVKVECYRLATFHRDKPFQIVHHKEINWTMHGTFL